ncbi:MAG: cytochrome c, partial [Planctomycetaceae bacterium]|nr:cytochrome c [Planctomycetaceae bacterium]
VLDKYGCAGCHTLELERWTIAADSSRAGRFSAQPESVELSGMPRLDATGALQEEDDEDDGPRYFFTLWAPAVIDGQRHSVGDADVVVPNARRTLVRRAQGGDLARELYPVLLDDARRSGVSVAEGGAWGWLPPPLVHEGAKVEPQWLFRFLLDPQAIRPAVAMRMPRFNLSTAEARKLTDCFAAVAGMEYPYTSNAGSGTGERYTFCKTPFRPFRHSVPGPFAASRLDDAMRFVSDRTAYCGRCHTVAGRAPPGECRLLHAPALDGVGQRLRPEYLRRWLADPKSVLPYTAMPALFPASGKPLGQDLLPGTSQQQLDAVVELLLQFDQYPKQPMTAY